MRQMDTILVAVGVPTKEVHGTSTCLTSQAVAIQNGTVTSEEQQATDKEVEETEDATDGWDIPDISDLLDVLSESEPENNENTLQLSSQDHIIDDDTGSNESAEETDSERISWSWDDTQWITEHTVEQKRPNS